MADDYVRVYERLIEARRVPQLRAVGD